MSTTPDSKANVRLVSLSNEDILKMVLQQRLATKSELQFCVKVFNELPAADRTSIVDVLVSEQAITPNQAKRLIGKEKSNQIPGFQLLEKIGRGCMGVVFKARQISMNRLVAIKILSSRLANDPEYIERFGREARLAAALSCGNIVQAIDVGSVDKVYYFIMEYVEGVNVQQEIDLPRVFSEKESLEIGIQIAEALKHSSARGLVHRDIKPANILLSKEGTAKLADLGLARHTSDVSTIKNEAGQSVGTAYYISPEQVRGLDDVDVRSDFYSLGATMYHMTTGKPPFPGETIPEQLHHHLHDELMSPQHVNTDLSDAFGELILYMMAKDRNHRYRMAQDLKTDMTSVLRRGGPFIARESLPRPV